MTDTLLLAGLPSLLIGFVLGALGGGGAILTVPLLVYVLAVEPKAAIATSLLFVGVTSLVGTGLHARAGRVRWRIGGVFGAAGMAGAFAGGRLARFVPPAVLLGAFTVVMLVTALAMLKGRREVVEAPRPLPIVRVLLLGAGVGLVSGFVGAGGGFLIVPALTLLGGLAMRDAIGTSLFVITLQSLAGFFGHAGHVELEWTLVGVMTSAAAIGMVVGAQLGKHVSSESLKRAFAWLVFVMGLLVLGRQLPPYWTVAVAAVAVGAALLITKKPTQPIEQKA